jgi:hypothetical protein
MTDNKQQPQDEDLNALAETLEGEAKKLTEQAQQAETLAEHPEKEAEPDPGLAPDFAGKLESSLSKPLGKLRGIAKSAQ